MALLPQGRGYSLRRGVHFRDGAYIRVLPGGVQSQFIRYIADYCTIIQNRILVARVASSPTLPRRRSRTPTEPLPSAQLAAAKPPPARRPQGCGGCWRRAALTSIQPVTYRSVSRVGAYFRAYFRVPRELQPSCSLEAGTDPLGTCSRSRGGGTINRAGGTVNRT